MSSATRGPLRHDSSAPSDVKRGRVQQRLESYGLIGSVTFWQGSGDHTREVDVVERLVSSLARRDVDVDAKTLAEAMQEVVVDAADLSSEPLSTGERDYLLESGGVTEDELSEETRDATRAGVTGSRAAAGRAVGMDALSTAEVTAMTGRPSASLRRSAGTGDLYVLNPGDSRGLKFPHWQFVDSEVVPGLSRIIPALPDKVHPLVVERFMTTERESLDGLSPVQWLATDGDVERIVRLADEEGRR